MGPALELNQIPAQENIQAILNRRASTRESLLLRR
jgi:hypothetical protein